MRKSKTFRRKKRYFRGGENTGKDDGNDNKLVDNQNNFLRLNWRNKHVVNDDDELEMPPPKKNANKLVVNDDELEMLPPKKNATMCDPETQVFNEITRRCNKKCPQPRELVHINNKPHCFLPCKSGFTRKSEPPLKCVKDRDMNVIEPLPRVKVKKNITNNNNKNNAEYIKQYNKYKTLSEYYKTQLKLKTDECNKIIETYKKQLK